MSNPIKPPVFIAIVVAAVLLVGLIGYKLVAAGHPPLRTDAASQELYASYAKARAQKLAGGKGMPPARHTPETLLRTITMKHGTPVLAAVTFLLGALAAGGDGGTPLPPLRANYPKIVAIAPPGDCFFTKMLDFHGIPIKASSVVSDEALDAAYDRLALELAHLPVVTVNLVAAGAQLQIIGKDQVTSDLPEFRALKGRPLPKYNGLTIGQRTRGMGGLETSCGEEHLLKLDKDRYRGRDICLHEFAHCIRDHGIQAEIVARACPPSPARLCLLPQRLGIGQFRHAGVGLRLLVPRPGKRRWGGGRVRAGLDRDDVAGPATPPRLLVLLLRGESRLLRRIADRRHHSDG